MVNSLRSDSILKLGKKIVDELGLDRSVDTLGRWMAHDIAEKIKDAETVTDEDRAEKMAICANAILAIWAHRNILPDGKRPFEDFEPIFRALESLDPESDYPRFHIPRFDKYKEEADKSEAVRLLELAHGIDSSARIIISYFLEIAANLALKDKHDWLEIARDLATQDDADLRVIINYDDKKDVASSAKSKDKTERMFKNRIEKLEAFIAVSQGLIDEIKATLGE